MKKRLGPLNALYPLPVVLVGSLVNDAPNFITVAHVGILSNNIISISIGKTHLSNIGIRTHGVFSLNIPTTAMVKQVDLCGQLSGKRLNKAALFSIMHSENRLTPMIADCPVNMSCRVLKILEFPAHDVFVAEIVETLADNSVLDQGVINFEWLKPVLFDMESKSYWSLGTSIGKAWSIGKTLTFT